MVVALRRFGGLGLLRSLDSGLRKGEGEVACLGIEFWLPVSAASLVLGDPALSAVSPDCFEMGCRSDRLRLMCRLFAVEHHHHLHLPLPLH